MSYVFTSTAAHQPERVRVRFGVRRKTMQSKTFLAADYIHSLIAWPSSNRIGRPSGLCTIRSSGRPSFE